MTSAPAGSISSISPAGGSTPCEPPGEPRFLDLRKRGLLARARRLRPARRGASRQRHPLRSCRPRRAEELCIDRGGRPADAAERRQGRAGRRLLGRQHGRARLRSSRSARSIASIASGSVERKVEGLLVSNGLAWTADGEIMFHADSRGPGSTAGASTAGRGEIADRTRFADARRGDRPARRRRLRRRGLLLERRRFRRPPQPLRAGRQPGRNATRCRCRRRPCPASAGRISARSISPACATGARPRLLEAAPQSGGLFAARGAGRRFPALAFP